MFKTLQNLLATVTSVSLSMALNEDDTITVSVIPKGKDGVSAKIPQLTLTGTADELDVGFLGHLANYSDKRLSLSEQLAATEAIMDAVQKESASKASKAIKKGATSKSASSSPEPDDDDDNGDGDDEPSTTTPVRVASVVAPKAPAAADDNLFM